MNEKALIGVWIMGAVLIAAVIVQNRSAARRWNALQSQGSAMGTVVGSRRIKVSGDAARTGHDIEYVDKTFGLQAPVRAHFLGVDAASRKFFSHPANELTLPEAAIIAGLVMAGGIAAGLMV